MDQHPCPNQLSQVPPNVEQNREYKCKYCVKTFSNKQALGGHYNAHKLERTNEKNAREWHDNSFSYYVANGAANYWGHYLGSYGKSQDLVDRSIFNNFLYNAQHQNKHAMRVGDNAARGNPYAPVQAIPMLNNVYPDPVAPELRVTQFPRQQPFNLQEQGTTVRFPNIGIGEASSSSRPVYPDLSYFAAPRNRFGMNDSVKDREDEDEFGLDLSLKL